MNKSYLKCFSTLVLFFTVGMQAHSNNLTPIKEKITVKNDSDFKKEIACLLECLKKRIASLEQKQEKTDSRVAELEKSEKINQYKKSVPQWSYSD